ncbi:MAG: serine/threonine-protein kinase [Cyanobacteria bacterium J06650_10]
MVYCPNLSCPQPQNPAQDLNMTDPSLAKFCQTCGTPLILRRQSAQYRLLLLLGQGGFGRTFLAERLNKSGLGGSQCVIKQLQAAIDEASFQSEAARLRKLGEHPQIPRLLDAIENELGQFLVQELAPGENLQQQVEAKGPWGEREVRSLLISLVKVLQYVHSFGIIHRDIKPENIVAPILSTVDQSVPNQEIANQNRAKRDFAPMLVDFGSAKWIRQTPAKTVIGSAGYASPEQSMGQATFASDIYSLGLTCLYLLTAVHPFQLYSAGEDRWVWQDYLSRPLEPRFVQVLDQMVERSLQQRYESADQVALDLQFSQNLLLSVPQKILAKAKDAVVPELKNWGLKNLLGKEGNAALEKINLGRRSLKLTGKKTGSQKNAAKKNMAQWIAPAAQQTWMRVHRLAPDMGLTQAIAISSDSEFFATGGSDGAVRLWQLSTAQLVHTFARRRVVGVGHRASITALCLHPDNRALYSASEDGTIKEWDVANRQLLNTIPVAGWTPSSIAITPEGTQLVSANRDGKMIVWDIASLRSVAQLTQHQRSVNAISVTSLWHYSGDRLGDLLVSASDDGTVKLWRTDQATEKTAEQSVFQLTQSINLRQYRSAAASSGQLGFQPKSQFQLKSQSKSQVDKRSGTSQDLRALSVILYPLSYNTYRLIVALSDGSVLLYQLGGQLGGQLGDDLNPSEPVCLHQFSQPIRTMAVSQMHCLAVGTEDRLLTLWQLDTLDCVAQLAHGWGVKAIAFTPDGKRLITASDDETLSLWRRDA